MKKIFALFLILSPVLVMAQTLDFIKGELMIQVKGKNISSFEKELSTSEIDTRGIQFIRQKNISRNLGVWLYTFNPSLNHDELIQQIKKLSTVVIVQKNHTVQNRESTPDDIDFTEQWHHKNTGQTTGTIGADIHTPEAWDITTGGISAFGDTIVACILEGNGGLLTHPDLINNAWHNYNEIPNNGIDDDGNGYIDDFNGWSITTDNDDIGNGNHGTQVASMIGATGNNAIGISGVNWNVKLMMVRGQNANSEASVLAAYDYPLTMRKMYNETNGAKGAFIVVTNASWGVDGGNPDNFPLWCNMYDSLGKYGILNIGATTNGNDNVEVVGDMPTQCTSDYLIGVTSSDHNDHKASAGYGTVSIDLAAPGRNVYLANSSGMYGNANGTSFASPCVAGAVALMYSTPCPSFMTLVKNNPQAAVDSMRVRLLDNVDLLDTLATHTVTSGRLNVFNSITAIMNSCDFTSCVAPFSLSIDHLLDTSVQFNWGGFAPDYLLDYREVGSPTWIRLNADTNFIDLSGLIACTEYEFQVFADCGTDTSEVSLIFNFTTDGCCTNPIIFNSNKTDNSLEISWTEVLAANSYDLRFKKSSELIWNELLDVISPSSLTGLDTCENYDIEIRVNCASGTQAYENLISPSTSGCGACLDSIYCTSIGNTGFEFLDSISIFSIQNGSGSNNGYGVFDDQVATFGPNSTYNIHLAPGYSGFNYTEKFLVYVDFDHDGEFNSTNEILFNVSNNGPVTGTISTPSSFTPGLTKMRIVMMGGNTLTSSCPAAGFYGEMEDYCVYLDPLASIEEKEKIDFGLFPNPAQETVTIAIPEIIGQQTIDIISMDGKQIQSINLNSNQTILDVSDFENGVYFIRLNSSESQFHIQRLIISK